MRTSFSAIETTRITDRDIASLNAEIRSGRRNLYAEPEPGLQTSAYDIRDLIGGGADSVGGEVGWQSQAGPVKRAAPGEKILETIEKKVSPGS